MDRSFTYIKNTWDRRTKKDPLHAVLTTNDESFFWPHGEQEIIRLEREGLISPHQHVLDYGCGVGRLTIPLAARQSQSSSLVRRDQRHCKKYA